MDPAVQDMMKVMLTEKAAAHEPGSASAVKAEPGSNAAGAPSFGGEKWGLEEVNGEEAPGLSVHDMVKTMLAEKAAAQASASAKKRTREEANGEEVPPLSVLNTPLASVCSPPPGFSGKPQHIPRRHDGDTTDWEAARELLQGAVAPPLERAFAAKEPSEVVKSSYAAILRAANYASFSFGYVLELEEKLVAREREAAALREQLEDAKAEVAAAKQEKARDDLPPGPGGDHSKNRDDLAGPGAELEKAKGELAAAKRVGEVEAEAVKMEAELAAARAEAVKKRAELAALKRAAEAEAEKAKAELATAEAVQRLQASEEQVRRRAEQALEAYERWRGRQAPARRVA